MADLDDFFAKKDRKKSKSVKKFATADELAKKLEDTKQKTDVRPKKERPAQEGEETGRAGEEEEWKDYEEPVKDYTGLKIQVLQGNAGAQESGRDSSAEDSAPENTKNKGPWNKPVEVEQAAAPPPPPPEEKTKSQPSTYVPPQSRNRDVEPVRRHQSGKKNAPDIHNDDYFPVLGAGGKRGGGWSTAGGGAPARASAVRQPLALGNRYTSLQDDS
ncbi:protein CDV3 homolog isoform X1 [Vanessa atalanta]|uniref:protein CDV3 homolog isoform X1 n=1 Tax=Vanessa atalanta TaxID=42275 RepID=UPI001FCD6632|nr:protein CDV3 homolog isoform X1 [Vanessa atalanta]